MRSSRLIDDAENTFDRQYEKSSMPLRLHTAIHDSGNTLNPDNYFLRYPANAGASLGHSPQGQIHIVAPIQFGNRTGV